MSSSMMKILNFLDVPNCADVQNNKRPSNSTVDMPSVKVSRLSQLQQSIHQEGRSPDVSVSN